MDFHEAEKEILVVLRTERSLEEVSGDLQSVYVLIHYVSPVRIFQRPMKIILGRLCTHSQDVRVVIHVPCLVFNLTARREQRDSSPYVLNCCFVGTIVYELLAHELVDRITQLGR